MLRVVVVLMPLAVICTYSHVTPAPPRSLAVDVIPTAEIDPESSSIGIADSSLYGLSPAEIDKTLTQLQSIGVQNIRVFVPWALIKMTGPNDLANDANWTLMNNVMDAARAHNMGVLAVISHTPLWAAPSGTIPGAGAPDPAVYADFVKQVATRYGDVISAYEVWNEPNAVFFYSPAPDPAGYTDLLKAAYPRIKAVDPDATVIGGVVGAVVDFGSWSINPVRFIAGMYAAGAKGNFDALSFHPYNYNLKFSDGMLIANSPVLQLVQMRQVMIDNGDDEKRIWATEYGEPTSVVNETTQAAYLKDIYTKWQEMPYTGPLMIYTTRDRKTGSNQADATVGLYRSDWTPKPAAAELAATIAAGVPKSPEFQRFSQITDPAHGSVLSPVFRATKTVWAQVRTINTIYEMPSGYVSSPRPVADIAMARNSVPASLFANGQQDFTGGQAFRVWWSPETGAHWASSAFAQAWKPQLGLATSDERYVNGSNRVDFQHGYMVWAPWVGDKVYYT